MSMGAYLHGYVKRDIKNYMFMTTAGNLGIRILGVLYETTHGLWALNTVEQSSL